ncbi:MAG: tetratricopeptide repeat protein [Kiritimatiellaeota bacterium]|nr:tetratricopeptide repeat protein [Kiritimatiellota bacterium]
MTQKKASDKPVEVVQQEAAVPTNLPLGLIPVYIWWRKNGSRFVMNVALMVIVAGVVFVGNEWRKGQIVNANKAFAQAGSVEDLADFVAQYGSTFGTAKIGNAARLRLARAYYDAGQYEEAFEAYETCLKKGVPGFEEVARLGQAHALEAMSRLDEALEGYRRFAEESPSHFLAWQAQMGLARVLALQGKKDEARNVLEILKAEKADDPMAVSAVEQLEGVINRYAPRAARSLYDMAEEAMKMLAPPIAPATGEEEKTP